MNFKFFYILLAMCPLSNVVLAMREYCELDLIDKDKTGTLVELISDYCKERYREYKERTDPNDVSVEMEEAKKFDKYIKTLLAHEEKRQDKFDKEMRKKLYTDTYPNYYKSPQKDGPWMRAHSFMHDLREWTVRGKPRSKRKLDAEDFKPKTEQHMKHEHRTKEGAEENIQRTALKMNSETTRTDEQTKVSGIKKDESTLEKEFNKGKPTDVEIKLHKEQTTSKTVKKLNDDSDMVEGKNVTALEIIKEAEGKILKNNKDEKSEVGKNFEESKKKLQVKPTTLKTEKEANDIKDKIKEKQNVTTLEKAMEKNETSSKNKVKITEVEKNIPDSQTVSKIQTKKADATLEFSRKEKEQISKVAKKLYEEKASLKIVDIEKETTKDEDIKKEV